MVEAAIHNTWRAWKRSPLTTITVVLLVAVSVGNVAAVYGPFSRLVTKPLSFPGADRLVRISGQVPLFRPGVDSILERERLSPLFEHVAAYAPVEGVDYVRLDTPGGPMDVAVAGVTSEFVDVLEVSLLEGSNLDGTGVGLPGMLISERLRRRAWPGSSDIIGSVVRLGGNERVISGVMPDVDLPSGTDVWVQIKTVVFGLGPDPEVHVIGRLRPGVSMATAGAALRDLKAQLPRAPVTAREPSDSVVEPLQTFLNGDQKATLRMLLAAAFLFLLIACAGIGSLLAADGVRWRSDTAIRLALGAPRSQLVARSLADTCLTVSIGGALGLLFGWFESTWLHRMLPELEAAPAITPGSIALVAVLCLGVAVLGGLGPALRSARTHIDPVLRPGAILTGARVGWARLSYLDCLAAAQLTLAITLTIAAGVLVRGLVTAMWTSSGVETSGVVTFNLELPRLQALLDTQTRFFTDNGLDPFRQYGPRDGSDRFIDQLVSRLEPLELEQERRNRLFFETVLDRLAGLPDVLGAASAEPVPFTDRAARPVVRRAYVERPVDRWAAESQLSVPYAERKLGSRAFDVLGLRFVAGRAFSEREVAESAGGVTPAVIGEVMANRLWPGTNPIGMSFFDSTSRQREHRVVGVVANDAFSSAPSLAESAVYIPPVDTDRSRGIVVKVSPGVAPTFLRDALSEILNDVSPRVPQPELLSLDALAREAQQNLRASTFLLLTFSALGATVAGLGVYGIVALVVAVRRREMAVRLALGAPVRAVRTSTLWRGLRLACAAIPVGTFLGWLLVRSLALSIPYQFEASLSAFVGSSVFVFLIAALAGAVPTLRIGPSTAAGVMRQE